MKIEHAAAQRQGHDFGDVNGKIPEARHRGKHRFERHDGDERDQNLRFGKAARPAQRLYTLGLSFRGLIIGKGAVRFDFRATYDPFAGDGGAKPAVSPLLDQAHRSEPQSLPRPLPSSTGLTWQS